jgi:hypothetical protein
MRHPAVAGNTPATPGGGPREPATERQERCPDADSLKPLTGAIEAQGQQAAKEITIHVHASALLNSTRTTDHASALQRVCSITRRTRLMRSQGCQRRTSFTSRFL